jgi:UDP-N-acetylglucosamine diphosphorylase / glucose-1-phosphate thymidylyltransferase / UDP-N-acetylgalactosamine diphosphorylase / glucosamine-1-phosphate N-acetyltransferase / galactosamine-1-phosphate N-acetyltransferase
MATRVLIFEDAGAENLRPLAWTRPVWELRCGMATLGEKIAAAYGPSEVYYHARPHLAEVIAEDSGVRAICGAGDAKKLAGSAVLAVNGRVLADGSLASRIPLEGPPQLFLSGDTIVAARLADGAALAAAMVSDLFDGWAIKGVPVVDAEATLVRWPWDLVNANGREIAADFKRFVEGGAILGEVHATAILDGREPMHIGPGARVGPGAILVARDGPIYIGPGAEIMAGAVVEGPAVIGADSRVKILAKIYGGTTIGPVCRVGGEVEQSVLHAYANKQHDGFLGHSYISPWCNLGADTNTSDLKNNYSNVRVAIEGREVDSGSLYAGLFMGDHSKSGINTMFNTGTVVGVGSNVFGADFPPKEIPSFAWGGAAGLVEHEFGKFCETAARAMARRQKQLTPALRAMLEHVFHQTRSRRKAVCRDA